MQTFNQFMDAVHRTAAAKHGISVKEARSELPASTFWAEWRDYVVKAFNEGEDIPTRMWREMDEGLRYRVLRSRRALKDDALTKKLLDKVREES